MNSFSEYAYKITSDYLLTDCQNDEFVWGINKEFSALPQAITDKINNGLKYIKEPWHKVIPYYKNGIFVFKSKQAIQTFLFNICKLTDEDINIIKSFGYQLHEYKINCISSGYSDLRGVIFEDEILSDDIIDFDILLNNDYTALDIVKESMPFAKDCKRQYYDNKKFKIYFK